jgi:hypothetical protein
VYLPKGAKLSVSLEKDLSTSADKSESVWEGFLEQDVSVGETIVWKAKTPVRGIVCQSSPTGRLKNGNGILAIQLSEIGGIEIDGGLYAVEGDSKGNRNAKIIGGTAALGALIGIISDKNNKPDHALGGAVIGAAVGTAVAAGTSKTEIRIRAREPLSFELPEITRIVLHD